MSRLSDASDKALACRDLKHAWTWATDFVDVKDGGKIVSVIRALSCSRCGTIRYDEFGLPSMNKVRTSYTYQQDYHIFGGHIPVNEVRQELYARKRQPSNRRKK